MLINVIIDVNRTGLADAAAEADVIFTCLPNTDATKAVLEAVRPGLATGNPRGLVWLDATSGRADAAAALADELWEQHNLRYLDCVSVYAALCSVLFCCERASVRLLLRETEQNHGVHAGVLLHTARDTMIMARSNLLQFSFLSFPFALLHSPFPFSLLPSPYFRFPPSPVPLVLCPCSLLPCPLSHFPGKSLSPF